MNSCTGGSWARRSLGWAIKRIYGIGCVLFLQSISGGRGLYMRIRVCTIPLSFAFSGLSVVGASASVCGFLHSAVVVLLLL